MSDIKLKTLASSTEISQRDKFNALYKECPIPEDEILAHLSLFVKRQDLSKVLFFNEIYEHLSQIHGVIMEFGVRWGRDLVTLANLRGIYEPFNYSRKIIGFDTFEGFVNIDSKDGNDDVIKENAFGVTEGYETYLEKVMTYHEQESPLSQMKKFEIVKGDASVTLKDYLDRNPETLVGFAYFDMDIYKPTRDCLELLLPKMCKGAIIGFDELACEHFPGETIAMLEQLGTNVKVRRNKFSALQSYIILD